MKKQNKNLKNKCAFCGKQTIFYFKELACFVCQICLLEYKKSSFKTVNYAGNKKSKSVLTSYDDWSTNKNIFTYMDKTTVI